MQVIVAILARWAIGSILAHIVSAQEGIQSPFSAQHCGELAGNGANSQSFFGLFIIEMGKILPRYARQILGLVQLPFEKRRSCETLHGVGMELPALVLGEGIRTQQNVGVEV